MKTSTLIALGVAGLVLFGGGGVAIAGAIGGGGRLSIAELLQLAQAAGFSGGDLLKAVAIAMAESGGDPAALGDTSIGSGTGSFGLWQINADAHPEYGPNFAQLYDPTTNANAAYAIYQKAGFSFSPWSTYKSGAYLNYVSTVQADPAWSGASNA